MKIQSEKKMEFCSSGNHKGIEKEKKEKEAAIDQKETDCPVLIVRTGNVLLHIRLHFNEKKEVTADDLFHRLVTERVLKDDF